MQHALHNITIELFMNRFMKTFIRLRILKYLLKKQIILE